MQLITIILEILNKLLSFKLTKSKAIKPSKESYAKTVLSESRNFRTASSLVKQVVDNTCIDRFIVLIYHNDGKPIDEAKIRKVSILFEGSDVSVASVMNEYQNFEVDDDYHKMIINLRAQKHLKFENKDAPKIVKFASEQEGLKLTRMVELCESEKKDVYVFASMSSKKVRSMSFREKNEVLIAVTQLRPVVQRILRI